MLRLRRLVLLLLSVAAAALALAPGGDAVRGQAPVPETVVAAPTPVPPTPTPVPAFRPVGIELPTLGVTAPIVSVGIDADGAMGTPKTAHEVAWWDGTEVGAGNALLAGHRDWRRKPGSFYSIGTMKPGDPVVLVGDGVRLEFRVEWIQQVGGDAPAEDFLGEAGQPVVTLITCAGEFDRRIRHYTDRVIVRAVLA